MFRKLGSDSAERTSISFFPGAPETLDWWIACVIFKKTYVGNKYHCTKK